MKRSRLLLLLVSGFFLIELLPEATLRFDDLNDANLHQIVARQMADRAAALRNPLDFFSPTWACGFPLFGHYQMLPHLALAAIYLLTLKLVSIAVLYHLAIVALLAFYPWNYYLAAKRFGLSENTALAGAVLSLTAGSQIGFGHEFGSYTAIGAGLYTQLVGMAFFPWALALGREVVSGRTNRWFWPLCALTATLLSHVFLGYLAVQALGFWWLLGLLGSRPPALKRLVALVFLLAVAASFFLLPLLINAPYQATSRYEPLAKLDSHGLAWVLSSLFQGRLLDAGRLPILTASALAGFALSVRRRRGAEIALATGFLFSLLLFAGRTTWGELLRWLPMSADMHFERFIIGVQFFGVGLAGVAGAYAIERLAGWRRRKLRLAAYAVGALLVVGLFVAPHRSLAADRALVRGLHRDYQTDAPRLQAYFAALGRESVTRVWPGARNGWGSRFRVAGVPMYFLAGNHDVPLLGHLPFGWALPGDFTTWLDPFHWDQLDLFGVSHILSWRDDRYWGLTPVYADDPYAIYATPAGNHLFRVVDTPFLLRADKRTYWNIAAIWMQSDLPHQGKFLRMAFTDIPDGPFAAVIRMTDMLHFTLKEKTAGGVQENRRAVFDGPIRVEAPTEVGDPGNVVSETRDERWTAIVEMNRPAVVMLKMTYHPFWRATVNGRTARPIMVSPGYAAVECPAGRHEIAFRYQPPWWKSALLLLLIGGPGLVWFLDKKRVASPADETLDEPVNGLRLALIVAAGAVLLYAARQIGGPTAFTRLENMLPAGEGLRGDQGAVVRKYVTIGPIPFDGGLTYPLAEDRPTEKLYRLDGRFRVFEAFAGVNLAGPCNGPAGAQFDVWADNELVYRTAALAPGGAPAYVDVDVYGKRLLRLEARTFGGSAPCKLDASWAEARLYR